MSSLSRQQLVAYLNKIDVTGKNILDVGSGSKEHHVTNWVKGKPREYVSLDAEASFEPDITYDLNHKALPPTYYPKENLDFIFAIETFEHLWNPVVAMENLLQLVKSETRFIISVPFINPIHDTWDYLRYTPEWFVQTIETLIEGTNIEVDLGGSEHPLEMIDFKIISRIATEGSEDLQNFYKKEGLRMSKIRINNGEAFKLNDIGYIVDFIIRRQK